MLRENKEVKAYLILTSLVICGLAGSIVTASKVVHLGINFPFSNIIFSIFTYPIIDCICELWGKSVARQTLWLGLASQFLITCFIQLSVITPFSPFWHLQDQYQTILGGSYRVITAGLLAFAISQILDIFIYQKIKEFSQGKWLWLRSTVSTYVGQVVDSSIFVMIVFYGSDNKLAIWLGSIVVKMILSLVMTPVIYFIVMTVNRYLDYQTLAFKRY